MTRHPMSALQKNRKLILSSIILLYFLFLWSNREYDLRSFVNDVDLKNITIIKQNIVGFWHIGPNYQQVEGGLNRDQFVKKQAGEILDHYLFSEESLRSQNYDIQLNYVTTLSLAEETKDFLDNSGLLHELPPTAINVKSGEDYLEFVTLAEVHSFCQKPENEKTIVFYVHSKTNDRQRNDMQDYLLGKSCLKCMKDDKKIACGFNYRGTKHFHWHHFSGNFWMARCSHVSSLNFPYDHSFIEENGSKNYAEDGDHYHPPFGRFRAEYWLLNDAGERPTDHVSGIGKSGLLKLDQVCSNRFLSMDKQPTESIVVE